MLFEATREQGLEGIVSKRRSSRYELRRAHPALAEVRAPPPHLLGRRRLAPRRPTATGSAALLVGEPTPDGLLYRGRVGSGIAGKVGPMLLEALAPSP